MLKFSNTQEIQYWLENCSLHKNVMEAVKFSFSECLSWIPCHSFGSSLPHSTICITLLYLGLVTYHSSWVISPFPKVSVSKTTLDTPLLDSQTRSGVSGHLPQHEDGGISWCGWWPNESVAHCSWSTASKTDPKPLQKGMEFWKNPNWQIRCLSRNKAIVWDDLQYHYWIHRYLSIFLILLDI